MALSTDILNTTLADLRESAVIGFQESLFFYPEMEKRGKVTTEKGTYVEWPIPYGSPATATALFSGDEVLDTTRSQRINKYSVEPHRIGAAISISGKDMDISEGKRGALKLIKAYPLAFMEALSLDIERYLLTGVSNSRAISTANLSGLLTLNGQFNAGVGQGITNGLLDFTTPALQTDTVQNVAKAVSQSHYNQYVNGTGAATLVENLRALYRSCAHFSGKKGIGGTGGGPQSTIMDSGSFGKWQAQKTDMVRIVKVDDNPDKSNGTTDVLFGSTVYESQHIVLTDFTGDAANGVTYMLNWDFIEWFWYRKPQLTNFEDRLANQDAVVAKFLMHGGWKMEKLTAHGCADGTNLP